MPRHPACAVLPFPLTLPSLSPAEAPVMVEPPQQIMVKVVNDMVILRCEAEADPGLDLAYVWTHNGLPIDYHEIDTRYHRLRQPGYLQIRNVSLEEDGMYRCTARTAVGEISAESRLTIAGPPEAPGGVQAFELNATSGRLEWQDFDDNGRHISMYRIEARTNWNSSWFIIKESEWRTRTVGGQDGYWCPVHLVLAQANVLDDHS